MNAPLLLLSVALASPLVASAQISLVGTGGMVAGVDVQPPLPPAFQPDDILVMPVEALAAPATPPGWTKKLSYWGLHVFWKRATAGEPAPVFPATYPANRVVQIAAFRGAVANGDPFEAAGIGASPYITTVSPNAVVLLVGGAYAESLAGGIEDVSWYDAGTAETSISPVTAGPATTVVFSQSDAVSLPSLSESLGLWYGVMTGAGSTGVVSQPVLNGSCVGGYTCTLNFMRGLLALTPAIPTAPPSTPGVPTGPTITGVGPYDISWTAAAGAVSWYELYENDLLAYSGPSLAWNANAYWPGEYRYHVQACNVVGCSAPTADHVVSVFDPAQAPTDRLYPMNVQLGAEAGYALKLGTPLSGPITEYATSGGTKTFVSDAFVKAVKPWRIDVSLYVRCARQDTGCGFAVRTYKRASSGALTLLCEAGVAASGEGTTTASCTSAGNVVVAPYERLQVDVAVGAYDARAGEYASFVYGVPGTSIKYTDATFAVGVLPEGGTCPNGDRLQIHMDDSDVTRGSYTSGWTADSYVDVKQNTNLFFCKVDGAQFRGRTESTNDAEEYAVLKLGDTCPNGSYEFARYVDNQDERFVWPEGTIQNDNWYTGDISPNTQDRYGTLLRFCLFRDSKPAMAKWPDLGITYGVFGAPGFTSSNMKGYIQSDDQDPDNKDRFDIPAPLPASNVFRIIDGQDATRGHYPLFGPNRTRFNVIRAVGL